MHSEKQPFMLLFSEYFYDEWPTVLWFYSSPSSEDTTIFIFRIYISTIHFIYSCLTTAGNSQLCAHTFTSGGRQQSSASAIAWFTNFTRASTKQQHNDDETLYVLDQTDKHTERTRINCDRECERNAETGQNAAVDVAIRTLTEYVCAKTASEKARLRDWELLLGQQYGKAACTMRVQFMKG